MPGLTVKAGELAVKTLLALNGGAAIAVLAFLGSIARSIGMISISPGLAHSMLAFALGAFLAVLTAGFGFISQAAFGGEFRAGSQRLGRIARTVAMISASASLMAFISGAWFAANAFKLVA